MYSSAVRATTSLSRLPTRHSRRKCTFRFFGFSLSFFYGIRTLRDTTSLKKIKFEFFWNKKYIFSLFFGVCKKTTKRKTMGLNDTIQGSFIGKFFQLEERKTDFTTELKGALATFLTMAYILAVKYVLVGLTGSLSLYLFPTTC